jgi:methyl-accepting chemotaxis protein
VEATRAGEAGQGFATVTADIRKLARSLAANAEDGKDVVRAIQDSIHSARRDLDQIAAAGEVEAARNQGLLDRFAQMAAEVDATRADNGVILAGAEAIQQAAREVKSGCEQIAQAAELAAEAAREAGVAAQQQAQGTEMLAAAVEDIASLAQALTIRSDIAAE